MFDPVVSEILEELTSIAIEELKEEVTLAAGVKGEVDKLRLNLRAIQAVLAEAELKRLKKDAITSKAWLDELKKAAYDIEDVLDKWDTAMRLKSLAEEDRPRPAASNDKRKVRKYSFLSSLFSRVSKVGLHYDIGLKIRTLNEKLDDIAGRKGRYHLDSDAVTEQVVEYRKTTSGIDITEVKGRKKDENLLINMLLSESSETPNLHTISLVGVGGIGKTTLAKLAYNDDKVEAHFSKRIWVCVSHPFDEIKIAKAILESFTSSFGGSELETLVQKIKEFIKGKKFLLVLDDVWNKEPRKWEQMKYSLMHGASGSRILVTTRNEEVARIMGSTESGIFRLGLLSEEDCRSIFSQIAFSERTSGEREQLEEIGDKIVKKCKGLPLATKALGGLLRFRKSKEQWQRVLDGEVWQLEEDEIERDLFAPLFLSYFDLSFPLRQCFSYCAIFPKNHRIFVDELIELWMAQGFLSEMPNKNMEMLGEEYFQNLTVRSFFQDLDERDDVDGSMIRSCKMHDMVHDFAQFVSKDECFGMEKNESENSSKHSVNKEARHLYIAVEVDQDMLRSSVCNVEKLHSLFINSRRLELLWTDNDIFLLNRLICLRSLSLSECDIREVPSSIGRLIYLRNLNLSHNFNLERLPESICDLINLQTLNVYFCNNLKVLPQGIGKLINLMHLRNDCCDCYLPEGIARLNSLRRLDWFNVGSSSTETASLRDLRNLKHLGGSLEIRGLWNVNDVDNAKEAQLKQMYRLSSLCLRFGDYYVDRYPGSEKEGELIEALEPSSNLEFLSVWAYRGPTVFPSWMESLTNLRRLRISECFNWEYLPPLGKLSSLERLELRGILKVKKVGNEFLGLVENNGRLSSRAVAFPKLIALKLFVFREWEEWDMDGMNLNTNILTIMPCIVELTIRHCSSLKKLPDHLRHLTTLQYLTIELCPILEDRCKRETGEEWHKISHIPNVQINDEFVQKEGKPTGLKLLRS